MYVCACVSVCACACACARACVCVHACFMCGLCCGLSSSSDDVSVLLLAFQPQRTKGVFNILPALYTMAKQDACIPTYVISRAHERVLSE